MGLRPAKLMLTSQTFYTSKTWTNGFGFENINKNKKRKEKRRKNKTKKDLELELGPKAWPNCTNSCLVENPIL